jgi:glutamate dehydrogenase
MAVKAAEIDAELIDSVCVRVGERLPGDQVAPCQAFVRQYYHWVPPDDLADRSSLDLYGAAVAHWNLLAHRPGGSAKVRVYNPDFEQDGWQSTHTVVEVVSDDMPFLVDSVTMELGRQGHSIHLVIHPVVKVRRDAEGNLLELFEPGVEAPDAIAESVLHVEVSRDTRHGQLDELRSHVERVLGEVRAAVEDWRPMRGRVQELVSELGQRPPTVDASELDEAKAFLSWIAENHFTFVGYREYDLVTEAEETGLRSVPGTGLGILRDTEGGAPTYSKLPPKGRELARAPHVLVLTKANSRSTVHRPAYLD